MASRTVTMTMEEWQEMLDNEVKIAASQALQDEDRSQVWSGIEMCLSWVRNQVSSFFLKQFTKLPVIGRWASRISVCVSELLFTVLSTLMTFLKTVFTSPLLWQKAHRAAMATWDANENNGLLAQTYAYSKKMASYFLEIIKQCLERAIIANNMEVTDEEKAEIKDQLNDLLDD